MKKKSSKTTAIIASLVVGVAVGSIALYLLTRKKDGKEETKKSKK